MRSVLSLLALATVLALAVGTTVSAHHSFGATYDVNKKIQLKGKLVQFAYRNPHSFVHVEAPDADGVVQRWAIEWGGTAQLANAGVKRDSLKIGDDVVIIANPSRVPGEYRVLMVNLTRPADGFSWGRSPGQVVE
ncbi:MAG TPA: DUF6152 family protein [Vicinamibacterales bacterium]